VFLIVEALVIVFVDTMLNVELFVNYRPIRHALPLSPILMLLLPQVSVVMMKRQIERRFCPNYVEFSRR
jgi:hypothetical protein